MITRTFKLCLNAGTGSAPYINVSQYDEGETWLFELYSETGERYIPTTGAIVGVKSDGHGIANTGTVDSEGRVVIAETQQMTASAGRAIYELSIDGLTHGTANFIVAVERKPTDDAVMSDSDLSLIQEAIDSAEVIVEVIGDGDPSEVIGEHVDAWLDNHPEATTTVQDGAITAPKINQSLWDKLLVSEEASGAVASFDDGADDVPVSSLKVALEPIQTGSGDPSPSNIRPIYPANGKNYLDTATTTSDYITYTQGADYYITASPSNSDTRGWSYANCQYKFTLPAGTYKFVWDVRTPSTMGGRGFRVYKSDSTILADGYGATLDTNGASSAFTLNESTNVGVILKQYEMVARFMIVRSTDNNSYQPYQGIMVTRTGKNLLNMTAGGVNDGQRYSMTGEEGNLTLTSTGVYGRVSFFVTGLKIGQQYTFSVNVQHTVASGNGCNLFLNSTNAWAYDILNYNLGTTVGQPQNIVKTFIATTETLFVGWYITSANASGDTIVVKNAMLEHGDTVTEYDPFTGNTYPYTLGQTVYGGTVDLATGVLTITKIAITKTLSQRSNQVTLTNNIRYNFANFSPSVIKGEGAVASDTICDLLPYAYANTDVTHFYVTSSNTAHLFVPSSVPASQSFTVVAVLATPTTVQLTPQEVKTLIGYNNISSSGTVDVIYHADTKLYVDKMTAVDNAIIAPTEADFVATRNYTVNDLVIVNDTLYKVTANIATGSAITPNSNVTATTLSTLIKALS